MASSWGDHRLPNPVGAFREIYQGTRPTHLSRAPGRVNLLGDHTDYNGLPVLPMALRREVRVVFAPREDATVRAVNRYREYGSREFTVSPDIPMGPPGDWGNYLRAPAQHLTRRFGALKGLDALVCSSLPVASGLSSSSALVIAMARALLAANDIELPALELADEMARAERYTGTQGGAMDQAISVGAREGHAARIEFEPLQTVHIPVPEGWRFIVAHSLVRAEKSGPAQEAYNLRTRECAQALRALHPHLGAGIDPEGHTASYRRLLEGTCLQELVDTAEAHLEGPLLKRFRHVVTEGNRVYGGEHALRRDDPLTFGLLMNGSHQSLRDDYEVSSPELNRLVELALEAGARGARLTGAGFGGCIVALAEGPRTPDVVEALREGYYRDRELPEPVEDVLFVAQAAGGASVRAL